MHKKGFTLIEVLIVMGLLGIIFSLTAFISMDNYRGSSFRDERDALIGVLQRARNQATNNICLGGCTDSVPHAVHITATEYTIFQGNKTYDDSTRDKSTDEIIKVDAPIQIVPGGFSDVVFSQLSGDATTVPAGVSDLTLNDTTFRNSKITIQSFGQITWTN